MKRNRLQAHFVWSKKYVAICTAVFLHRFNKIQLTQKAVCF